MLSFSTMPVFMLTSRARSYEIEQIYYADTMSHFMRTCMHGADYPDSWRNYDGPGFNTHSKNQWCYLAQQEFRPYILQRVEQIYRTVYGIKAE